MPGPIASSTRLGRQASASSPRSRARDVVRHVVMSSRTPSASGRIRCAVRWSSEKPGSVALASSAVRRSPARLGQDAPRSRRSGRARSRMAVWSISSSLDLEQLWPELEDPERRLAAGDDGVDAGAVIVRHGRSCHRSRAERHSLQVRQSRSHVDQVGERLLTELGSAVGNGFTSSSSPGPPRMGCVSPRRPRHGAAPPAHGRSIRRTGAKVTGAPSSVTAARRQRLVHDPVVLGLERERRRPHPSTAC